MTEKLMAVTRTSSKGSSLRMTLPKEIAEILNIGARDHVGFYYVNGRVVVRKID
jgi:bifunctional DNA-binding transcriptional regulator/antitoxin component of YhaV-PrlF toxin-antitoxin module